MQALPPHTPEVFWTQLFLDVSVAMNNLSVIHHRTIREHA
jgi:hypothetical protein